MNIFTNEDILHNILHYTDIKTIEELLKINRNAIIKCYHNYGINLNTMPIFVPCNDIELYLEHYHSYLSGTNFPEQPLWLFRTKEDGKFLCQNSKLIEFNNIRFERPLFLLYKPTFVYIKFIDSIEHWQKLNQQQKYLVWCAITGTHPEIKLDKNLGCDDMSVLISEAYWHYPQSFSRYYLDVYFINEYNLLQAKFVASEEIRHESKILTKTGFNNGWIISLTEEDLNEMLKSNPEIAEKFQKVGVNNFEDYNKFYDCQSYQIFDKDYFMLDYKNLNEIWQEMKDFNIEWTGNIKSSNLNYIFHMDINYGDNYSLEETIEAGQKEISGLLHSCAQQ